MLDLERRAIVVDDGRAQAEAAAKVLTSWGLTAHAFTDPDAALTFAQQHRGTIVFTMLDLDLRAGKWGIDYARRFRSEALSTDIILVTGYRQTISSIETQELKNLGITVYDKPIDLDVIASERLLKLGATRPDAPPTNQASAKGTPSVESAVQQPNTHPASAGDSEIQREIGRLAGKLEAREHKEGIRLSRWEVRLAAISLVVTLVIAYLSLRSPTRKPEEPRPSPQRFHLKIAEGTQPIAAPVYVASDKFWKSAGLDVELVSFTSGRLCLDAVLNGKAHLATAAETPIMHAALQGKPVVIIAGIHRSQRNTKVIARRSAGISQVTDLKGKKVAVSLGTNGEFFMDRFLGRAGLTRRDVEPVNLRPEDMLQAITDGDVSACFTWEPHVWNIQKRLGQDTVLFPNDGVYTETYNIVTTAEFAAAHGKEITLLLDGLAKAMDYIQDNPDDAISIVARRISMEPNSLNAVWSQYTFRLFLDRELLQLLQEEAAWSRRAGHESKGASAPDFRRILLTQPLKAVRPEAVTVE